MTDNNQANEDELRARILAEFRLAHKLAPADYTESCTNVVMSIIRTEKLKLLDELDKSIKRLDEGYHKICVPVESHALECLRKCEKQAEIT